ncbi:hypothetical protein D910_06271 [Dendroctonus ponderosae]
MGRLQCYDPQNSRRSTKYCPIRQSSPLIVFLQSLGNKNEKINGLVLFAVSMPVIYERKKIAHARADRLEARNKEKVKTNILATNEVNENVDEQLNFRMNKNKGKQRRKLVRKRILFSIRMKQRGLLFYFVHLTQIMFLRKLPSVSNYQKFQEKTHYYYSQ